MPVSNGIKNATAATTSSTEAQRQPPPTAVSLAPVMPTKCVVLAIASACTTPAAHPLLLQKSFQALDHGCLKDVIRQPFLIHVVSRPSLTLFFLISDNAGGRTLPFPVGVSSNTIESCTSACRNAGYNLAGTEYAAECWCGYTIQAGGAPAPATECNMLCSGDNSQYCGGPNRLNLYKDTDSTVTPPTPPAVVASVGPWVSQGCYMSVIFSFTSSASHP